MIKMKPTFDHVVVIDIDDPGTTPGGIVLPDNATKKATKGIVQCVGPACEFVAKGSVVLFPAYTGTVVEVAKDDLRVLKEEDILMVVE